MRRSMQTAAAITTSGVLATGLSSLASQQQKTHVAGSATDNTKGGLLEASSNGQSRLATQSELSSARKLQNACQSCHVGAPFGPAIWNPNVCILEQPAGTAGDPDYPYSSALLNSNVVWNDTTLDEWLKDPRAYIAGTYMSYVGMDNAADRQEAIATLKSFCAERNDTEAPTEARTEKPTDDSSASSLATMDLVSLLFMIGTLLLGTSGRK